VLRRVVLLVLAVAMVGIGLSACVPPPAGTPTTITTEPPLFPAFRTDVTNYVIRCDPATSVAVHVTAPTSTLVSVDGGYPRGGIYGVSVDQQPEERFTIAVTTDPAHDVTTRYSVRCLPTDFPPWTVKTSPSGATRYVMVKPIAFDPTRTAIYDRNGVPLWWSEPRTGTYSLLPNGNLGALVDGALEERTFDGTFVRTVSTVDGPADAHDALLLPNGPFVRVAVQGRTGVDLTALGGPANATVCDDVVQEIDPADGSVVWSWDTFDHVPPGEMDPQFKPLVIDQGPSPCGYDVYHWNSIEPTATGFIVSYRHLDAVYDVDQATDNVVWKLGGSTRAESLSVVGDPVFTGGSHFGGQHDARLLADGTVTLFDDGTGLSRPSRAVRYSIDTAAHTATLLGSADDPTIPTSVCCGSARYVSSNDWFVGWGGTSTASELVGGVPGFSLTFPNQLLYRAEPLTSAQVSPAQLDAAMDARFLHPVVVADAAAVPPAFAPFP
jgi:hypothetical protein